MVASPLLSQQINSLNSPSKKEETAKSPKNSIDLSSKLNTKPNTSQMTNEDVFSSNKPLNPNPNVNSSSTAVLPVPIPVQIIPSTPPTPFWQKALETIALTGLIMVILNPHLIKETFNKLKRSGGKNPLDFSRFEMIKNSKIKLADVIGADEAKEEIAKVLDFIKNPEAYKKMGAKLPSGILLSGPPGTGKTLLAKAIAGESELPMISANGSEFVNQYVGTGADSVRALFRQARQVAEQNQKPVIIFIDEIDTILEKRDGQSTGSKEYFKALNQLLSEMDGVKEDAHQIIVIGATNADHSTLDSAALRGGRFGTQVRVDLPDLMGRKALLEHYGAKVVLDAKAQADLANMAQKTYGMSGADIANILNEAAMLATRKGEAKISVKALNEAYDNILMGSVKEGRSIREKDKVKVAYHEAGHAIVQHVLDKDSEVNTITIAPRNKINGFMHPIPKGEYDITTQYKNELENKIAIYLAGRVAEAVVNGTERVASGASSDFKGVSSIVNQMVYDLGMFSKGSKLVPMSYRELGDLSETQRRELEQEMQVIVTEQYQKAEAIIKKQRPLLEAVKDALMKHETLDGDQFQALVKAHQV
jgi:cell division protease FtsH